MLNNKNFLKFAIIFLILFISFFHYMTPTTLPPLHEIYKVLYFIPIIFAAFAFGMKGGLGAAAIVTVLYLPHVMFQWGGHFIVNISRFLMIFLYNIIGGLTGYLWQKEQAERKRYQQASEQLKESLNKLEQRTEELAIIENQLRMAERLSTLGELTASLAHEVRNPLGSIRGVAEILRDESHDPAYQKFVDILLKETQRLDAVVANYLSFARSKNPARTNVDLHNVLQSVLDLLGPEIRKKNLRVNVSFQPEGIELHCNEGQIRQALVNILLNAIQVSPEGSTIAIEANETDGKRIISIQDSGPGVTPEVEQHLFEPFFTTREDGTGLGLAITRRIVESHQGTIRAQNNGDGFKIIMEFPHNQSS